MTLPFDQEQPHIDTPLPVREVRREHRAARLGMLLYFALLIGFCLWMHRPSVPVPASADPTAFSAERAMAHVEAMAREPHRTGTEANYRVRQYIEDTLRALGVEPVVKTDIVVDNCIVGNPEIVMGRVPGHANTRAIVVIAHYDSTPFGAGAADDIAGCATMLESCRAIKAGPQLKNDVIFLFSDAEERGLHGPRSFREHPWFEESGLMLNLESRGVSGPSYLFETTCDNGWLVPHLAKALPHPIMTSMTADVYRRMPFSSDFNILKDRLQGANVAMIDKLAYYHTPNDNPANLNRGSLQHHGDYALPFLRYFGDLDLSEMRRSDSVTYFNAIGDTLVYYPSDWNDPLTVLVSAVFIGLMALALLKKWIRFRGFVAAYLLYLLAVLFTTALVGAAVYLPYRIRWFYALYHGPWYVAACLCLTIAAFSLVYFPLRRRIAANELVFGAFAAWETGLILLAFHFSSAQFLMQWPLFFSMVGFALAQGFFGQRVYAPGRLALLVLSAMPVLLLMTPTCAALFIALTLYGAPLVAFLMAMTAGLLFPHLEIALPARLPWLPAVSGIAGAVLLAIGLAHGFSVENPQPTCLSYAYNADSNEAWWVSRDREANEWTSQFIPPDTPRTTIDEFLYFGDFRKAPAPVAPVAPPQLEIVSDEAAGNQRKVTFRISSPRGGNRVRFLYTGDAETNEVHIDGEKTAATGARWSIDYTVFPRSKSALLSLLAESGKPLRFTVVDVTYELPVFPEMKIKPRPGYLINEPNTVTFDDPMESGTTIVVKTFQF